MIPSRHGRALPAAALLAALVGGSPTSAGPLTPPLVLSGEVGDGLWAYGQVNKGLMVQDDGKKTLVYPLVDNGNSSTRAGLWWKKQAADDFNFSANVEAEWNPYSTTYVNRSTDSYVNWSQWRLRHAEAIFEFEGVGKLWLGQGASASDGLTEKDLSGTDIASYASISDGTGGQLFALKGGGLSGVRVGNGFDNLDGLGRMVRVRYDTPSFGGFRLQSSAGKNLVGENYSWQWDLGGSYDYKSDAYTVTTGLAYSRVGGKTNRFGGSASILHNSSGFNVTIAAGADDAAGPRDPYYVFGKLGWKGDLIEAGQTAFSVDVYSGSDINVPGSDSLSVSLAAVQNIPAWQTELYAMVRWHDYDDNAAAYENGTSFLTGARFKF